jgi:phage/plasmid-associated DNA primase
LKKEKQYLIVEEYKFIINFNNVYIRTIYKKINNLYSNYLKNPDINAVKAYIKEIIYSIDDDLSNDDYYENFIYILSHLLTNDNSIKKILTFKGLKNSGKSALLQLLLLIFDNSCCIAPRRLVINSKNESLLGTEYIPLIGKRSFFISELKETEFYNEPLLKSISGNDKIFQVRESSNKGYNKVIIQAKGIIATNESANYSDDAFISRLIYIKFPNYFESDSEKLQEILSLRDHLFTILCNKAYDLIQNKFRFIPHPKMIETTKEENETKDTLKIFIEENYSITGNKEDKIHRSTLYPEYSNYCQSNDLLKIGRTKMFSNLRKKPYN